jgi:ATP-dependent Lhr-like helicase
MADVSHPALAGFHPGVRAWFESTYDAPTDVQSRSWPRIMAGAHALITAPTGSGKTLTAFLAALDAFATARLDTGATRVLYVSPLKALNNDIQRNLLAPLSALQAAFSAHGENYPGVRVATRSGDTPSDERQRLLRRPPEILVTTPESLQLMLTTDRGRAALATIETVILDEIHSVVDNRRGVVLSVALERLVQLAGEMQRIALSATVRPLERVAAFVAGSDATQGQRPIDIICGRDEKTVEFSVRFPDGVRQRAAAGEKIWEPLADAFRERIAANRATLFFTNSRRLAEQLTLKINDGSDSPRAYAHHGSLARDIRSEVESRLKRGDMKAIVATNSLEMGIDIGHLDEVVLIQSPPSIASTLQRIGRAGHGVGETSRGTLFPTHARDFIDAAALASAIDERDIEPTQPVENPLDILAQLIVAFTASETWRVDDLFNLFRQAHPYRRLPREQFDLVVEMLAGRYAGSRVRDLKPRIVFDRIAGTARATKGATLALYSSGGTIPDRGYFQLRHADSGAKVGELDEEFVWEATIGQVFAFGNQHWQIARITHNDVLVSPARTGADTPPFWRAEGSNRSFHYSARIGAFLEGADARLAQHDHDGLIEELQSRLHFDAGAATELLNYLDGQRSHTQRALPHRHHVLIENIATGPGGYKGGLLEHQIVLHTFWGGRVNRPFALVIGAALRQESSAICEIHATDDAIVVQTSESWSVESIIDRLDAATVDTLLRIALESSGFFGARFRECAGRALLLTRSRFNQRLPLWMSRMHAKKLMATVARYADFPVLLETWRTCLSDEFDLQALNVLLADLRSGAIALTRTATASPSPFAANIAWRQISSTYMYADDTPQVDGPSALSDDLIRAAVRDESLRPGIKQTVVDNFVAKRQRTAPGYEMVDARDLDEWLKERVLITEDDWRLLTERLPPELAASISVVWLEEGDRRWLCHPEQARHLARVLFHRERDDLPAIDDTRDAADVIASVLSFYGPLTRPAIRALLPQVADDELLRALVDDDVLVGGALLASDDTFYFCDADNLEILLRMQRAAARFELEPRAIEALPGHLAAWHQLGSPATDAAVLDSLERLRGWVATLPVWLDDLMAARHVEFDDHVFDSALAHESYVWLGCGRESMTVCPDEEQDLIVRGAQADIAAAFRDAKARYPYLALADAAAADLREFNEMFWRDVWRGAVSADSIAPLRQGMMRKFEILPAVTQARGTRRRSRAPVQTFIGNWHLNATNIEEQDPLTMLEDGKQRARMLLERYGIVSRELANREGGVLRWAEVFRALRVMELAGEVIAGLFFTGMSGPQFALPRALRALNAAQPPVAWWVSAADPIAPCGLGVNWTTAPALPHRRPGAYLAFSGSHLSATVEGWGRRINFAPDLDAAAWTAVAQLLTHLLSRQRTIALESIDGAPAAASPLLPRLGDDFQVSRDHRGVELSLAMGRR